MVLAQELTMQQPACPSEQMRNFSVRFPLEKKKGMCENKLRNESVFANWGIFYKKEWNIKTASLLRLIYNVSLARPQTFSSV